MERAYRVLDKPVRFSHEQKRSLFDAYLEPVTSREQAMEVLARLRTERPGASHYCWAYILGDARQPDTQAFSDDGEPGGTAGKPMLNVLEHREAGNCLAVVVRFFGGVKLGAGGLVRAYSAAVSGAVEAACWRDLTPEREVSIRVDFALEERVRHLLAGYGVSPGEARYDTAVTLAVSVPADRAGQIESRLRELTSGAAQCHWH